MKCKLKISLYCEKKSLKDKAKYIEGKACCRYCYYQRKKELKDENIR